MTNRPSLTSPTNARLAGALREHHADARLIRSRRPVRRVVQLQDEIGVGFDEECRVRRQRIRRRAGHVADQPLVGERALGRAIAVARPLLLPRPRRRDKRHADRVLAQPLGIRRALVQHGVMHQRTVARADFERLHPRVLGEARRENDVGGLDGPRRRHVVRLGHLDHFIGRADVPAVHERSRRREHPSDRLPARPHRPRPPAC